MDTHYRKALNKCHPQLRDDLSPDVIVPYLNSDNLLSSIELEELQLSPIAGYRKIDKILAILPTKGEGWWDKFLNCLSKSTQGTAHDNLKTSLEDALKEILQKDEKDSPLKKEVRSDVVGGHKSHHQQQQQQQPPAIKEAPPNKLELSEEELKAKFKKRFDKDFEKYANKDDLKAEPVCVLIQTVNNNEFYAVMLELKEGSEVKQYAIDDPLCASKSYYYVGKWGNSEIPVAIIQTGMGGNDVYGSWYETKKALYNLPDLKYIFAVGVCGGIRGKVKLGEVIVSKAIWGYPELKMTEPRWISRSGSTNLENTNIFHCLSQAARLPDNTKCGIMMSGPWLIRSVAIQGDLLAICPEGIAFEMEGDGIVKACRGKQIEYLVVKGVCDFGDQHKNDDWQPQAATNAAKSLCEAMTKAPPDMFKCKAAEE